MPSRKILRSSESVPLRNGDGDDATARCVLLIDDDLAARDELMRGLRERGWSVVIAENARDAMVRAADAQPVAIVSELLLAYASGYQFARALKTMIDHDVPLIGVTRASVEEFARAREAGFEVVLGKPVDAATIDALLRQSLAD